MWAIGRDSEDFFGRWDSRASGLGLVVKPFYNLL